MIRLFDLQNGKIIPTEHCYTIGYLKDIMEEYPEDHISIYAFLFYMTCPNEELNPYFNIKEDDKESIILQDLKANFTTEDPLVITALNNIQELFETPTSRAHKGIKIALDNMADVMCTTKPTFGRDGSATALLKIAEKFDSVRQSYKGVYKDLQDEQQTRTRGGGSLAYDQ
jgi:hypothetical protein